MLSNNLSSGRQRSEPAAPRDSLATTHGHHLRDCQWRPRSHRDVHRRSQKDLLQGQVPDRSNGPQYADG